VVVAAAAVVVVVWMGKYMKKNRMEDGDGGVPGGKIV
jgi:hypothetical protein